MTDRASRPHMPRMRLHNFNAGPSVLPLPVLEEAQRHLVDHRGLGLSVLEMSHRSPAFQAILDDARDTLRRLLGMPDDYEILFLQGGASLQFAMVPSNLGPGGAYVDTGVWSQKAIAEAKAIGCRPQVVWSGAAEDYARVPGPDRPFEIPGDAPYLHFTSNNTIYGTWWQGPASSPVPLVCDMSSDFLSQPIDVERFDLIYAGAQKNAGPAGVTLVVGKRATLEAMHGPETVPTMLRYRTHVQAGSLYNTANTFGIWLCSLVFRWIESLGGLQEMERRNEEKAGLLYEVIDRRSDLFQGHAARECRSHMNVTFRLPDEELERRFLAEAEGAGCIGLAGHRSVGGLRASIYNALPRESVEVLAGLMDRWQP